MPGPLVVSLSGRTLTEKEKKLLSHKMVGGLVLFRENYDETAENPKADLKKLISEIRAINKDIVIMVDHEGGKVWRFTKGFTKLPAANEYGLLYDKDKKAALEKAFQEGYTMANELLDCGIDMSLTPVVDLDGPSNVIGKYSRAFHKNPQVVAEIAEAFIKGMNQAGMPATLKHFPGHGTCALDSHVAVPVDDRNKEALEQDLTPFKILIKKKLAGAIMSNFVTYPAVDPKHVAAFSKAWLQDCLRKDCGFEGVVMSDCLHMKGADVGNNLERLKAAQTAGNDFLMYTHQHNIPEENLFLLDELLSILDNIPDSEMAAKHRAELRKTLDAGQKQRAETTASASLSSGTSETLLLAQFDMSKTASAAGTKEPSDTSLKSDSNSDALKTKDSSNPYSVL